MSGIQKQLGSKFSLDIVWNLGSFALAGVLLIAINTILLKSFSEEVVGVFNQVYAIYIVLSQLAVFGVHLSVQVFVPRYLKVSAHGNVILSSALFISLVFSLGIVALALAFSDLPGKILHSKDLVQAFPLAIWGLVFFSFNKVLLAFHNGHRRMRALATFQLLRVAFMFGALFVLLGPMLDQSNQAINSNHAASILAWSELGVFVVLLVWSLKYFRPTFGKRFLVWTKIHWRYGYKALPGNFLLDINTRVDVIMLGLFLSDGLVGIYAFALSIAEGVMQVPVVFRNNINPIITKAKNMERKAGDVLSPLLKKNVKAFYQIIGGLAFATIAGFPIGLWLMGIENHYYDYWIVYSILIGSMILVAGYLPFQMIFNQLGKPGTQSRYILWVTLVNVIANLLFIQLFGIFGAAIGTGISLISQMVFLKRMLKTNTGLSI